MTSLTPPLEYTEGNSVSVSPPALYEPAMEPAPGAGGDEPNAYRAGTRTRVKPQPQEPVKSQFSREERLDSSVYAPLQRYRRRGFGIVKWRRSEPASEPRSFSRSFTALFASLCDHSIRRQLQPHLLRRALAIPSSFLVSFKGGSQRLAVSHSWRASAAVPRVAPKATTWFGWSPIPRNAVHDDAFRAPCP